MKSTREKYLITELKLSNHGAFTEIHKQYSRRVYAFSLKSINNPEEAEGIVQTVFLKLWENRENLDENQSLLAYLFKLSKNLVINIAKKKLYHDMLIDYLKDNEQLEIGLDSKIDYKMMIDYVQELIANMPERRKEIFLLNRNESLTYHEIAQKLNITENTVDSQIRNSLNYLRENVETKFGKLFS